MNYLLKRNNKGILFIAITTAFLSQVYLQTNMFNLRISLGIIMLPICYYMAESLDIVFTGIMSAICVYVMRIITYILVNNLENISLGYALRIFSPEMFFYLFYFMLFKFIMNKLKCTKNTSLILWACIICDFLANSSEMIIRGLMNGGNIYFKELFGIAMFAIMRSLLIWIMINVLNKYSMLISRKEHEIRYKKLLDMTSKLKTELYWMEKSMDDIENVMSIAYNLYYKMEEDENHEVKDVVLDIAKDIHEIKKQNMLVFRGLEETLEDRQEEKGMCIEDIFDILDSSTKKYMTHIDKKVNIKFKAAKNFYTRKHYYLMSMLRNLIMNSIDAVSNNGNIYVEQAKGEDGYCILTVKDNGTGISERNKSYLFSPGFSTKINYDTGSINRGLGLSVVKEIVENKLGGFIKVESEQNQGTKFMIYIPNEQLEN